MNFAKNRFMWSLPRQNQVYWTMKAESSPAKPSLRLTLSPATALRRRVLIGTGVATGIGLWALILLMTSGSGLPGYEGPAGVGDRNSNVLWLELAHTTGSDGSVYPTWTDISGNGHDATQSGNRQPVFRDAAGYALNGRPVLRFDGSNDYLAIADHPDLNTGGPYEAKTVALVFRTGADVSRQQFLFEEGGNVRGLCLYLYGGNLYFGAYNLANDGATTPWPFRYVTAPVQAHTAYVALLTFDYAADALTGYLDGSLAGTATGIGHLHNHPDDIGLGAVNQMSHDHRGVVSDRSAFGGDIAELIAYNVVLNEAERQVMTNYLAAKFGVSIPFDYYAWEVSHSHEVAGLGQQGGGAAEDAAGLGPLRLHSPSDLDAGEYLIWGHDGTDLLAGNTLAVDGVQIKSRLDRTWRVSETGELGQMTLVFDLSTHSGLIPADVRLIIERNGDDFATVDVAPQSGTYDPVAQTLTFTGVNPADGDLLTLGSTSAQFPVAFVSFEAVPGPGVVDLRWTTGSELNNAYFEVERSGDGLAFQALQRVPGAGTTTATTDYATADPAPLSGRAYYRLRQVDYSGTFSHSHTVEVYLSEAAASSLRVFPNPVAAGEAFAVRYQGEADARLQVVDLAGRLVHQTALAGSERMQEVQIPTANWPRGRYYVQVQPAAGPARHEALILR